MGTLILSFQPPELGKHTFLFGNVWATWSVVFCYDGPGKPTPLHMGETVPLLSPESPSSAPSPPAPLCCHLQPGAVLLRGTSLPYSLCTVLKP